MSTEDGRTVWYPEDAGWLSWERVVILGEEFGPAAISVLSKLKCDAKLQNAGWRVKAGWRSLARAAFVDDVQLVHQVVERAAELGVLDDLTHDEFNFTCKVSGMAASERKARAAGRQQAARDRAQTPAQAKVTERDAALRGVTTGDEPSPTGQKRTEEDIETAGEGARGPADNLAADLASIVVAGDPSTEDLEHLRSFAAYAVSQGVQDAQLLAKCAKDPRPASLAANAALILRDAQAGGQAAWEQLAAAVVAGDTDPAAAERWMSARGELKDAVGAELFDTWLSPLTALCFDGDELVLGGPGPTVAWVQERFGQILTGVVGPVRLIPVLTEAAA